MRGIFVGAGARVSGFTLTNGFTAARSSNLQSGRNGGGAFLDGNGTISNCVAVGNSAGLDAGGIYGGRVFNCIVTGNSAGDDGGGVDQATIYNSIISNNRAGQDGGGVDDSIVYNSVLRENEAEERGGAGFESSFITARSRRIPRGAAAAYADGFPFHHTLRRTASSILTTAGAGQTILR